MLVLLLCISLYALQYHVHVFLYLLFKYKNDFKRFQSKVLINTFNISYNHIYINYKQYYHLYVDSYICINNLMLHNIDYIYYMEVCNMFDYITKVIATFSIVIYKNALLFGNYIIIKNYYG